jgi:DNA-binding NarL/FixJ family response regulator
MSPLSAMAPLPATTEASQPAPVLTPAERRVLHLLIEGRSNKGIAAALTLPAAPVGAWRAISSAGAGLAQR